MRIGVVLVLRGWRRREVWSGKQGGGEEDEQQEEVVCEYVCV